MTTVIYMDGYLLADTGVVVGEGRDVRTELGTKVGEIDPPIRMTTDYKDLPEDTYYGWYCTGTSRVAMGMLSYLTSRFRQKTDGSPLSHTLLRQVMDALSEFEQMPYQDQTEIHLVGEQTILAIQMSCGYVNIKFVNRKESRITMGSGGHRVEDAANDIDNTATYLYFMAMLKDPTTCGWTEHWAMWEKDGKFRFKRIGLTKPVTDVEIIQLLARDMDKEIGARREIPPDLLDREEYIDWSQEMLRRKQGELEELQEHRRQTEEAEKELVAEAEKASQRQVEKARLVPQHTSFWRRIHLPKRKPKT